MKFFLFFVTATAIAQTPMEKLLLERIANLEARLAALESASGRPAPSAPMPPPPPPPVPQPLELAQPLTTVNATLDAYYQFNFRRPSTGANALRAYDVSHNSISLNQATLVLDSQTNASRNRYVGGRLDLQFGQATATLQGNSSNEPRPDLYRHVFQAYGSLLAPVGKGVSLDIGKFASALGLEGNFTKDQFNYSRSYFFNYLPFYHMGLRATYPISSKMSATYWLVNGINQTEDFNAPKSQAIILSFTPRANLFGNVNYYNGRESAIAPAGRFHILDTYWTLQATRRLTLAAEADYVLARATPRAAPGRITGGAAYAKYQLHPNFFLASRYTLLNDNAGLFGGVAQNLRDFTLTATYQHNQGFQLRWEIRRDSSNQPFFATANPNSQVAARSQTTALIGLIWWMGAKQGSW
jgi:hypothetical protein